MNETTVNVSVHYKNGPRHKRPRNPLDYIVFAEPKWHYDMECQY